jgi:1-acyl-sn-glycerol-3-phosphate acyltransferase
MLNLRSLIFNLAFYVKVIILMILGLPMMLFGRKGVFFMARLWGATSVWLLEKICHLRVEYRGVENIPVGGYIIAAKHQSFLETFSLVKYSPDFAIIMKKQLMYIPVFGLYLIVGKQIGIDRDRSRSALAQLNEQAGAVLRAGRQVYIYPEGTRRPPGATPMYKSGVAALYKKTGAPCLPVALNTGLFWGRRGFRRRPGTAVIEYLPPIPPGLDRDAFETRLESVIEAACARLNEEAVAADPSLASVLVTKPLAEPKRAFLVEN